MYSFKKVISILIHVQLLFAIPTQKVLASWPIFTTPDLVFLIDKKILVENGCPQGQFRLSSAITLNIRENFCRSFCPPSWRWSISGDGLCHNYVNDLLQDFKITYVPGSDGATDHSIVTVKYNSTNSSAPLLQTTMATKNGEHWHCYLMNQELHLISCANDI